jgi:hypothetical protein
MTGTGADEQQKQQRRVYEDRRRINQAGVLELVEKTDVKHDDAHKRLRIDFRELEERLVDATRTIGEHQRESDKRLHDFDSRLTKLSETPLDVSKVMFAPKVVISIVFTVVAIYGAMWAQNLGLRSDVRDILTQMAAEKRVTDANAKLLEVNNATINRALDSNAREMKDSIAAVTKRQDLLTLQYNQMSEQLTRLTAQRER